jgi:hypothetical protein
VNKNQLNSFNNKENIFDNNFQQYQGVNNNNQDNFSNNKSILDNKLINNAKDLKLLNRLNNENYDPHGIRTDGVILNSEKIISTNSNSNLKLLISNFIKGKELDL